MSDAKRRFSAGSLFLAMTVAAGCGGGGSGDGDGDAASEAGLSVLSAFYPIHEIVTRIGGDRVEASNLTPAGVEPHDLELTSDEIEDIEGADAVFYLGQRFMPALERALRRADGEKLNLLEGLPLVELDPHVWLDPTLMIRLARQVEETLSTLDPDGEAGYARRRAEFQDDLEALDAEFKATLVDCRRNVFVTSHAAFGYLARRYALEEQSVSGVAPETEPDPDRIAELAALVERLKVPVIFSETLLPKKLADTLGREAGVKTDVLNPIEGLTEDQEEAGSDYLSVMRENLAALDRALDCVGSGDDPAP